MTINRYEFLIYLICCLPIWNYTATFKWTHANIPEKTSGKPEQDRLTVKQRDRLRRDLYFPCTYFLHIVLAIRNKNIYIQDNAHLPFGGSFPFTIYFMDSLRRVLVQKKSQKSEIHPFIKSKFLSVYIIWIIYICQLHLFLPCI